ncbi:MAG: hypothetical protein U0836_14690 [Pirellulales bacterium]
MTRALLLWALALAPLAAGCHLPELAHQPRVHNPFPQLHKVAIAPFFNLSTEPTVDGREFALAYFNELQRIPGYEVVPVGVVEQTMKQYKIGLSSPEDARKLAEILGVDAVVIGAVTDFTPWFPPRCAMQVEWYARNPCFQPIPPGYALPWGTTHEEEIPDRLLLEAEFALAEAQLKTQTPDYTAPVIEPPPADEPTEADDDDASDGAGKAAGKARSRVRTASAEAKSAKSAKSAKQGPGAESPELVTQIQTPHGPERVQLPPDWPDASGLWGQAPQAVRPECLPSNEPVMRHTRTYNGNDGDFDRALRTDYVFRDDPRPGGPEGYLQRMPDFIRMCCQMHIYEMLSARGGADKTRVVFRWPHGR